MISKRDFFVGALGAIALAALALTLFAVTFATTPTPDVRPSGAPPAGLTRAQAEAKVRAYYAPLPSGSEHEGITWLGRLISADAVQAKDRMGPLELQQSGISADRWIWLLSFDDTVTFCSPALENGQPTCWRNVPGTLQVTLDYFTGETIMSGGGATVP